MKILFIEWASFGNEDIKEAFTAEGHSIFCFPTVWQRGMDRKQRKIQVRRYRSMTL